MSPMKEVTIHARRWQVVLAFLAVLVATIYGLILINQDVNTNHRHIVEMQRVNRNLQRTVHDLNRDKASIRQLETSNCTVKEFLLSSARLRRRLATTEPTAAKRAADLQAARVSDRLARAESNQLCPS